MHNECIAQCKHYQILLFQLRCYLSYVARSMFWLREIHSLVKAAERVITSEIVSCPFMQLVIFPAFNCFCTRCSQNTPFVRCFVRQRNSRYLDIVYDGFSEYAKHGEFFTALLVRSIWPQIMKLFDFLACKQKSLSLCGYAAKTRLFCVCPATCWRLHFMCVHPVQICADTDTPSIATKPNQMNKKPFAWTIQQQKQEKINAKTRLTLFYV